MEPMDYKILKILDRQPQQRMYLSELQEHFPNVPEHALRLIIAENLNFKHNVTYSDFLDETRDFIFTISDEGRVAYYKKKYSDFINRRTLWANRIVSFILGILTTVITGSITWLITSGTLLQLILQK